MRDGPGDGVFHHEARKEEETLLFLGGGERRPREEGKGSKAVSQALSQSF